jgi:hypothetical protein
LQQAEAVSLILTTDNVEILLAARTLLAQQSQTPADTRIARAIRLRGMIQPAAPARVDSLLTPRAAQDHNDQLPVAST